MNTHLPNKRKVVLITGGSKGIGAALVKQLDRTMFEVWVAGRDLPDIENTQDRNFTVDFSEISSVRLFLQALLDTGRTIDILINNAATVSNSRHETYLLSENYIVNVQSPSQITEYLQINNGVNCVINVISANGYSSRVISTSTTQTGVKGYFESKYLFFQIQRYLAKKYNTHCVFFSPRGTNTNLQIKFIESLFSNRSQIVLKIFALLNFLTLQNARKSSVDLLYICNQYSKIQTLSVIRSSGKFEKSKCEETFDADELAYFEYLKTLHHVEKSKSCVYSKHQKNLK